MATVLSGTSGALYYKPAGTRATFAEADVSVADDEITVTTYLNLQVGDPVVFSVVNVNTGESGTGTLPAGITAGTTYYVISYTASTGVLQVSATSGGSTITITDDGTAVSPNAFQVDYADYAAVGQVQNWSFEITRAEIDVTTIGQTAGQYAPFRAYIPGFADGSGSASVFITDDDTTLANRMIEDVLQAKQSGAAFKLYIDKLSSEALSRSIAFDASLLTASFTVNPDDAQVVELTFRPTAAPTIDFSKS